jgi:hypothetical protein
MARTAVDVPAELAAELRTNAMVERLATSQAEAARLQLARLLAQAQAEGFSVRALGQAAGLSPKRVRLLLRESAG